MAPPPQAIIPAPLARGPGANSLGKMRWMSARAKICEGTRFLVTRETPGLEAQAPTNFGTTAPFW